MNETIENEEDCEPVDNMSSWFGGDIKYSFIFMFGGSIISVLAFGCLIVLCYKHCKLQLIMTYFVTTTPIESFNGEEINCQTDNMFLHVFYALLLLVALYYGIVLLNKLYNHFTTYNTILNFCRGHGLATGPRIDIVLEFYNLQDGLLVHIAQVQTPIPLISVLDDLVYPTFSIKPGHG